MGIDGENWWLCNDEPKFREYFDQKIDLSWKNESWVDCCNDVYFLKKYIDYCDVNKIDYRILYCKTELCNPSFDGKLNYKLNFLGYDYAYAGGSFYSCVKNDLVYRKFSEFNGIMLNVNGLLNDINQVNQFVVLRNEMINKYSHEFEVGDFIIYKLYEASS